MMNAEQFYHFASSFSQKLLCYTECFVKIHKNHRKYRKIFLSNLYFYVVSVGILKITRLYWSINSSQCVLMTTQKSILIDELSFREILKRQLKFLNCNIQIVSSKYTLLDDFVELAKNQQKEEESIILNLDNLSSQYIDRDIIPVTKSFSKVYDIESLILKQQYSIIVSVQEHDINNISLKKTSSMKQQKKQKHFTVKIYPFKLIGKNEKVALSIVRQRRCLQQILSPYVPLLQRCMVGYSTVYCISEYYKGEFLSHYVKNQSLNSKKLKLLLAQVTTAVGQIHQCNFIYNNINIDGIFITEGGYTILNQFDYCIDIGENFDFQQNSTVIRSPETFTNSQAHQAWDWWALGLMIFQLKESKKWKEGDTISWPKDSQLQTLTRCLLQKCPKKRLGWRNDYHEVLAHQYFKGLNKKQLATKQCQPLNKIVNINYEKYQYESDGEDQYFREQFFKKYEFRRQLEDD